MPITDWKPRYRVINLSTDADEMDCVSLGLAIAAANKFRHDSMKAGQNHHFAVIKSEVMFSTEPEETSNG